MSLSRYEILDMDLKNQIFNAAVLDRISEKELTVRGTYEVVEDDGEPYIISGNYRDIKTQKKIPLNSDDVEEKILEQLEVKRSKEMALLE